MDQENQINRKSVTGDSDRLFLYEVVLSPSPVDNLNKPTLPVRRAKLFLKVPYERMNEEMKRISKLGGKIVSITPIVEAESSDPALSSLSWWVEIVTQTPHCLYYFGPFESLEEAATYQNGYVEDLTEEGATRIEVQLKQAQPETLTQEWDE